MDPVTDDDVVLVLDLEPAGPNRRWRWLGGIGAVAVVVAVVGIGLLGRGSGGHEPELVEVEPASAPIATTPPTTVVAADQPPVSEVPEAGTVTTSAPIVPPPTSVPADEEEVIVEEEAPPPVTAPSRFVVVPGAPLPVGSPASGLAPGEVRLGPGGATFGPTAIPRPGEYLDDVAPDFVAFASSTGVICGYKPRGMTFAPPEGVPVYDVDGATVVGRIFPNGECLSLDEIASGA
jgi:hypothetical protein